MLNQLALNIKLPGSDAGSVTLEGPTGFRFSSLGDALGKAVPFVFAVAGFGLLLMLLAAGFSFLTSAGDAKKMETAKGSLTSALAGFLIIFVAYWIVQIAGTVFGIKEIQSMFK